MLFSAINLFSVSILFCIALWCIFSPVYEDGIFGKLIFIFLALSCYATITDYPVPPNEFTHTVMIFSIAAGAIREFTLHRIHQFIRKKHRGVVHD